MRLGDDLPNHVASGLDALDSPHALPRRSDQLVSGSLALGRHELVNERARLLTALDRRHPLDERRSQHTNHRAVPGGTRIRRQHVEAR